MKGEEARPIILEAEFGICRKTMSRRDAGCFLVPHKCLMNWGISRAAAAVYHLTYVPGCDQVAISYRQVIVGVEHSRCGAVRSELSDHGRFREGENSWLSSRMGDDGALRTVFAGKLTFQRGWQGSNRKLEMTI